MSTRPDGAFLFLLFRANAENAIALMGSTWWICHRFFCLSPAFGRPPPGLAHGVVVEGAFTEHIDDLPPQKMVREL